MCRLMYMIIIASKKAMCDNDVFISRLGTTLAHYRTHTVGYFFHNLSQPYPIKRKW